MTTIAEQGERIARVETRLDDLTKETSELKGAYDHLATKADIHALEARLTWKVAGLQILWSGVIIGIFKLWG